MISRSLDRPRPRVLIYLEQASKDNRTAARPRHATSRPSRTLEMDFGWLGLGECVDPRTPSDNTKRMDCCSSRSNTSKGVPWAEVKGPASPPALQSRGGSRQELYMGPRGARRGFGVVPMLPSESSKGGEQQSAEAPADPQGKPIHSIPTQGRFALGRQLIPVGFAPGHARIGQQAWALGPSCAHFSSWLCVSALHMCCATEAGSHLRRIDSGITQLTAQGPSRTCNESKEEEEKKLHPLQLVASCIGNTP